MKNIKLRILNSTFAFLMIVSGCVGTSLMGSKSEIIDQQYVSQMKYVDILPLIIKKEDNKITIPEADTINTILKRELKSRNLFQIINDEVLNDELKDKFIAQGAFLIGEISYFKASFGEINAKLTLKFVEPSTEKVILYSLHDTYLGNSYFLPASVEVITEDAIKGAIDELQSKLKK